MIFCLFFTLLLSVFGTVHLDDGFDVIWTDQAEAEILTEEEHKVAFRDVVIEGDNEFAQKVNTELQV